MWMEVVVNESVYLKERNVIVKYSISDILGFGFEIVFVDN